MLYQKNCNYNIKNGVNTTNFALLPKGSLSKNLISGSIYIYIDIMFDFYQVSKTAFGSDL